MSTREQILTAVKNNQPPTTLLPDISMFGGSNGDDVQTYMDVFKTIGGSVYLVADFEEVKELISQNFDSTLRFVTTLPELNTIAEPLQKSIDPHEYENVEVAIIRAQFGVAENGAVWVTEQLAGHRIIPYICQHLAVVIDAASIVPTLHEAYDIIGEGNYGFAGFIGGPSKTADIEQALVLGAHGPLTMTVFIVQ